MDVLCIAREEIESLGITMKDVMGAVETGFALNGQGESEMPPKIGVHTRKDCFLHAMPCWVSGNVDAAGLKWVGGYPPNQAKGLPYITGLMCLNDPETGFPVSVMDANWITAERTGAASGVCAKHLADPLSTTVAMIGLGVQGRTNLRAMKEALPKLSRVQMFDIYESQVQRFHSEMADSLPDAEFIACPDLESTVKDADVVITCTPIVADPERPIKRSWMKDDVLAISVDYDAAYEASVMTDGTFVCDNRGQYLWTQEQGVYFQKGYPAEARIYGDMGDVCAGNVEPVRSGLRGAVLMGIASHDVMTARLIYRKAREQEAGTWIGF
ncbi:MAG: ornithine cyclodeaminase family protein [Synergistales bacterium]|nr:ornithine cyclodeaminase family protein [Synergistales bacterium]